jgi:hypothetical protein
MEHAEIVASMLAEIKNPNLKRMARPSARGDSHLALVSLLQRIRSRVSSPAKIEIRAARSS